jgi:hypothetical protein
MLLQRPWRHYSQGRRSPSAERKVEGGPRHEPPPRDPGHARQHGLGLLRRYRGSGARSRLGRHRDPHFLDGRVPGAASSRSGAAASAAPAGARGGAAGAGRALRDRPGVRARRGARRRPADRHSRAQLPVRLGLHLHPAFAGHDPGRLRCLRDHAPGYRSRARRDGSAMGQGDRARPVLRGDRRGAAGALGTLPLAAAAPLRRQHGQRGAATGGDPLSARVQRGGAVHGGRRAWRPGRWRGLHHCGRPRSPAASA